MKSHDRGDPLPESGMGGASDMGAGGGHPIRSPQHREGRPHEPDNVVGDASYERRRRDDPAYQGPERRINPSGIAASGPERP